jgi:hypothetical protein
LIKNLLLVLKAEANFSPEMWTATWEQVGLQELKEELELETVALSPPLAR